MGADVTIRNLRNELAIDFPTSMEVEFYLSKHQIKTDPSDLKRNKKKSSKRGSFFRKYKEPSSSEKFDEDEFFEAI